MTRPGYHTSRLTSEITTHSYPGSLIWCFLKCMAGSESAACKLMHEYLWKKKKKSRFYLEIEAISNRKKENSSMFAIFLRALKIFFFFLLPFPTTNFQSENEQYRTNVFSSPHFSWQLIPFVVLWNFLAQNQKYWHRFGTDSPLPQFITQYCLYGEI